MTDIILLVLASAAVLLGIANLLRKPPKTGTEELERRLMEEMRASRSETAATVSEALRSNAATQADTQQRVAQAQDARLQDLTKQLTQSQATLQRTVSDMSAGNEKRLENIRTTMETKITTMQAGNEKKLDEMRQTVDEKLQKTLDERLAQSFKTMNDQLDKVHRGLGEMQTLATDVGSLKKVLSNVKTRGILGEIQLGAILEEILTPDQYEANVATIKGSRDRVEFAVKLPGSDEGEHVWLPIDAKLPYDAYANLLEAYDTGDSLQVEAAAKILETRIYTFAKDIRDKYIREPETTEFGIMFLPIEGLYAEVVRRGYVERLQREYKVNIAGPTTLAALLNSLQMGFRTLALQKRSGEVRKVLSEVQTEFNRFAQSLAKTQERLRLTSNELEELVGVRTRQMQRKLKGVTMLEASTAGEAATQEMLPEPDLGEDEDDPVALG